LDTDPDENDDTSAADSHRRHETGANVTTLWEGNNRVWAQVTDYDYHEQTYTIYFPDSGEVKKGVPDHELKPLRSRNPPPRRCEMIGKTFFCDGDHDLPSGRWKVRAVVNGNEFRCTRLSGQGLQNLEDFDIGWVTTEYIKEQTRNRERGIFEPVTGKRSSRRSVSYF